MKKTGIFYGSSTGTCEDLANQIADKMGVAASDVHSADKLSADLVKEYDLLILGTSTWGDGELQDDWYDGIKVLKSADLSFKSIALFGCGECGGGTGGTLTDHDDVCCDVFFSCIRKRRECSKHCNSNQLFHVCFLRVLSVVCRYLRRCVFCYQVRLNRGLRRSC